MNTPLSLEYLPFAAWVAAPDGSWRASNEAALMQREHFTRCAPLNSAIANASAANLRGVMVEGVGNCSIWLTTITGSNDMLVMCEATPQLAHHDALAHSTDLSAHMAASLAHEIRNPLLSIRGAAQLLADVVPEDDKPLAALIQQETARIDALIGALDPLSEAPTSAMQPVNIHEVLEYVRLAAEASFARHATFVMDYDPSLPELHGDRERLIQLAMNLVKNAAEACETTSEPIITLRTRYAFGEQRARTGGAALPIQLRISDNGAGIDEATKAHLFTPFTSSKEGGKGLGLSLVAAITKQHDGLIEWESSENGTHFDLYFAIEPS